MRKSHCRDGLGGAWTAHVIGYLREGECCFGELHLPPEKLLPRAHQLLRKLEHEGIMAGSTKPTFPPTARSCSLPSGRSFAHSGSTLRRGRSLGWLSLPAAGFPVCLTPLIES